MAKRQNLCEFYMCVWGSPLPFLPHGVTTLVKQCDCGADNRQEVWLLNKIGDTFRSWGKLPADLSNPRCACSYPWELGTCSLGPLTQLWGWTRVSHHRMRWECVSKGSRQHGDRQQRREQMTAEGTDGQQRRGQTAAGGATAAVWLEGQQEHALPSHLRCKHSLCALNLSSPPAKPPPS